MNVDWSHHQSIALSWLPPGYLDVEPDAKSKREERTDFEVRVATQKKSSSRMRGQAVHAAPTVAPQTHSEEADKVSKRVLRAKARRDSAQKSQLDADRAMAKN